MLQRSAVWLTIKESRASFAIEHEEQHTDRVRRFASVIEQRCGQGEEPLSESSLGELQAQILGPRATRYGLRRSPVFVGEVEGLTELVHYIAPHWDDTPGLLSGLRDFAARTLGGSALTRAAVLFFGFVYVHPMSDGNGRISRFLVNDGLRRDNAVPAPFILPLSATITGSVANRREYDEVLEIFSRPLMSKYAEAWRYPDLTDHVEYLAEIVQATIEEEMRKETAHLRSLRVARERLKRVIEGSDNELDRIIQSLRESSGKLSNKLLREFPLLADEDLAGEVVAAAQGAFTQH